MYWFSTSAENIFLGREICRGRYVADVDKQMPSLEVYGQHSKAVIRGL